MTTTHLSRAALGLAAAALLLASCSPAPPRKVVRPGDEPSRIGREDLDRRTERDQPASLLQRGN